MACQEMADLLALLCVMFSVCCQFPKCCPGSDVTLDCISPDLCILPYIVDKNGIVS